MTKKDFNAKVSEMCAYVKQHKCDDMRCSDYIVGDALVCSIDEIK